MPRALIAVPTFCCPLRCQHCDLWRLEPPELAPELWCARIRELGDELSAPLVVGISGGEPLVYGGILELVRACREAGLFAALTTSALPLDDHHARELLASGLASLVVSLDGQGPTHDALRGRPGLADHALAELRRVRGYSPGLDITVVTTVARPTVGQLVPLARWAAEDPAVSAICFHALSANLGGADETDPGWHRRSALWPGADPALQQELERLATMREEGLPIVNRPAELRAMARFFAEPDRMLRPCDQGGSGLMVLPDGSVKICPLRDPVGNIVEHGLAEIWRSAAAEQERQRMAACQRNCHFLTNFAYQRHELEPPG